MPPKSRSQQKLIYAKRSQYGSKEKTPKKWAWIWESGWSEPIQEFSLSLFQDYVNRVYFEKNLDSSTDFQADFVNAGEFVKSGKTEEDFQPKDEFQKELAKGIKVEMEHTTNFEIAKRIALDHIAEAWPISYYDKLAKMEKKIKGEKQ